MPEPATSPDASRIAVAGAGGFSGGELVHLLLRHPRLTRPPILLGRATADAAPVHLSDLHPHLTAAHNCPDPEVRPFAADAAAWDQLAAEADLLFLATPHEQSREWVPEALARGLRVVDLSGAWRLRDEKNRAIYKLTDADPTLAATLQEEAVYGAPELYGHAMRQARLVANPGCYATSIILSLAPLIHAGLIDLDHGIVCDSKSGVSGAGKAATATTHFMHAADNLSAYALFNHRHTGELLEQLHLTEAQIQFTPHLLPIPRGILSTIYLRLTERSTPEAIHTLFTGFFAAAPLVRIRKPGTLPQILHVAHTNFCDIGFHLASDGKRLILVSCLDNLLKGAASQAVQNMNLMLGWHEAEGLL